MRRTVQRLTKSVAKNRMSMRHKATDAARQRPNVASSKTKLFLSQYSQKKVILYYLVSCYYVTSWSLQVQAFNDFFLEMDKA